MSEVMVFTNLVTREGNFTRDRKAGTLTVEAEGIKGNFVGMVEAPDDPLETPSAPANDIRDLAVGSVWKPRPGISKVSKSAADGTLLEWYVLIPADDSF